MADENEMTWRLSDEGMDLIERAGLAGLYMALRAANEAAIDLSPLSWRKDDLKPASVTVRWTGPAKPAFLRLYEWSWKVQDGVVYLPAVHDERDRIQWWLRVPMHEGIMGTFLQHRVIQPKEKPKEPTIRIIRLDEDREIRVSFHQPLLRRKKLLAPLMDVEALFNRDALIDADVCLSNWCYPGSATRYGDEKSWEGMPSRALLIMLAPTVCLYDRLQGEGYNWIAVVPDVRDLEEFDCARRRMNLDPTFTDVASLADAGLHFMAEYSTRNPRRALCAGCRVVTMGMAGYYKGQSIRKAVLDIPPDLLSVKRYRILHRELPNAYERHKIDAAVQVTEVTEVTDAPKGKGRKKKPIKPAKPSDDTAKPAGYIKLPTPRGRIAENLVSGRPWYADLFVPLIWNIAEAEGERKKLKTSLHHAWFRVVCYQRSKLMRLIAEDDMWDTEAEKVFVNAFWETLDSLYAQEANAAKRGGSASVEKRWERLEGDLYRTLTRAKTHVLLREALAQWFAKAGRQQAIRAHPAAVWRLIDHREYWRKGRDLALLALASHRSKDDREYATTTDKGA